MAIKRATRPLGVNFTPEERELLRAMAQKHKRAEGEQVRWLVESYAKGELVTLGELKSLLNRYEREIPVLRGELDQYAAEGTSGEPDPHKKAPRHQKK